MPKDPYDQPTRRGVLRAMRHRHGTEKERAWSEAHLRAWGNAALPFLKEIAKQPKDPGRWRIWIISCLEEIGTRKAMDLLVSILAGESKIEPTFAISSFMILEHQPDRKRHLTSNRKFKRTIFRLAETGNWFEQSVAASVIAAMKWSEGEPLIAKMLGHENMSLRESAAKAMASLSEKKTVIRRPELSFPSVALNPAMISKIGRIPGSGWMTAASSFDQWFDETRGLIQWRKGRLRVFGPDLLEIASISIAPYVHDFCFAPLPGGGRQMIALVSDERKPKGDYVASFDESGRLLWKDHPDSPYAESLALLYARGGKAAGVVIGYRSMDGKVGLDLAGKRMWEVRGRRALHTLDSTAAAPGRFISCGGHLQINDARGQLLTPERHKLEPQFYAGDAVAFCERPGTSGLSIIAEGKGEHGIQEIARYGKDLARKWVATMPHDVGGLARIETEGGPLFAATTLGGDLILFNAAGTLLYRGRFARLRRPNEPCDGVIGGGLWHDGTAGLFIRSGKDMFVYRINSGSKGNKGTATAFVRSNQSAAPTGRATKAQVNAPGTGTKENHKP